VYRIRTLDPATQDLLISLLEPLEAHRLSLTSRDAYQAVARFRRRAFKIEKILTPFVTDWSAFRQLMETAGAVISGSQALYFFERTQPDHKTDLDIYVEHRSAAELGLYLVEYEDYLFVPKSSATKGQQDEESTDSTSDSDSDSDSVPYYGSSGIAGVFDFVRNDGKKIQIITAVESVMAVILKFHSSTSQYMCSKF
jgi:hypothetical protein